MNPKHNHIAFRCPDCTDVILGVIGESALSLNMRLKCTCGASALDITPTTDKKIKLSVPCILCKENHTYTVSPGILFERDIFTLNCPYANVNIAFIGSSEKIEESVAESTSKLEKLLADMGAEAIEDIQPVDMDEDDIIPDAQVYDTVRFIVKDLESEGAVDCPCHCRTYDLRYAPGGIQVFCQNCGATFDFKCETVSMAEEYISLKEIRLK